MLTLTDCIYWEDSCFWHGFCDGHRVIHYLLCLQVFPRIQYGSMRCWAILFVFWFLVFGVWASRTHSIRSSWGWRSWWESRFRSYTIHIRCAVIDMASLCIPISIYIASEFFELNMSDVYAWPQEKGKVCYWCYSRLLVLIWYTSRLPYSLKTDKLCFKKKLNR